MSSHQRKLAGICALILGMCWPVLSEEAAASTDATSELLEGVLENEPADQVALESEDVDTFADLDITALMDIEVVSVSGSKDNWFTTPAALTVITARDLERGGFQVLPEALRMVPGLNVGRLNASQWAVGVRGFNSLFANKLQVSVDGRSAYNLLFGGVIWNEVDMILPDVEQIEVVRGPGATLWGTNAVNGVINIRSKNAKDTQGWLVTGGLGTELRAIAQARYGGQLGTDSYFRVWTKYINHDGGIGTAGLDRPDDADFFRTGFRVDGTTSESEWTVQGDVFNSNRQGNAAFIPQNTGHLDTQFVVDDTDAFAGNLLGRIRADDGDNGWIELQSYFDTRRLTVVNGLEMQTYTLNNELRRQIDAGRHSLLIGLGYRFDVLDTDGSATLSFAPEYRELHQFRGFIQDTISFEDERWSLLLGSKFEYNDFTGIEVQPNARLSFAPDDSTLLWTSVSRAVRTPSSSAKDLNLILAYVDTGLAGGGPASGIIVPTTINGNPNIDSEDMLAFEIGYRKQVTESLLLDVATFYNQYNNLVVTPNGGLALVQNNESGTIHTWGGEVVANWSPSSVLDIVASYSFFEYQFPREGSFASSPPSNHPEHMAQLRVAYEMTKGMTANLNTYAVSESGGLGGEGYVRMDLGFVWDIDNQTKLSIWAQNLLDNAHLEATDAFLLDGPTQIERGVTVTLTKEF